MADAGCVVWRVCRCADNRSPSVPNTLGPLSQYLCTNLLETPPTRPSGSHAHYLVTSGSKSPYLRGERVGGRHRECWYLRGQAPGPWRTARIRGRTRRPTARRLLQARVNVWEGQRLHRHRCASAGIQGAKVTTRIARHSGQELLTRAWTFSSQPLHKA